MFQNYFRSEETDIFWQIINVYWIVKLTIIYFNLRHEILNAYALIFQLKVLILDYGIIFFLLRNAFFCVKILILLLY